MYRPRVPAPPVPGGFGFPLGFLAAILATVIAVAAGATVHTELSLLLLAAVTAAIAILSTPSAALAIAAVSWGLHAGFVLGRHGDLAMTRPSTRDAVILGAVAVITIALTTLIGILRRTRTVAIPTPRSAAGRAVHIHSH